MEEIWKDIHGYEGMYQVSNLGKVRALDRISANGHKLKSHLLRLHRSCNIKPHYKAHLCKNGKIKRYFIHRLVAEAFIPNPNDLPLINHKDENPSNNCVSNLEWCTYQYNVIYGNSRKTCADKLSLQINQYDKKGIFIRTFKSIKEAQSTLHLHGNHITEVCKGKRKTCGGYIWRYA